MALFVGASYVLSGTYTGTVPTGGQYAFDTSATFGFMSSFTVNTANQTWQGTITLPAEGAHTVKVRKTNIPDIISAASGSFTVTASSGGGSGTGTVWKLSAVPTTGPLTTPQRRAKHAASNWGICGSLTDATPAQYANLIKATNCPVLRTNYVGTTFNKNSAMASIRSALSSISAPLPNVKVLALPMAYRNDTIKFTDQQAALLAAANAGYLWGIGDWNEMNNYGTGEGSRGPNDTNDRTDVSLWPANYRNMCQVMYDFLTANSAAFFGVKHLSPNCIIFDQGTGQVNSGSIPSVTDLVDYGTWHNYPGAGRQPTFEGGDLANTHNWVRQSSVSGLRRMVLTETGASTASAPGTNGYFARAGNSAAKYNLNAWADVFRLNGEGIFFYQGFDGNGNVGDYEGNLGFVYSDKATFKPIVNAIGRLTSLCYINNNPADAANASAPTTYLPGINAAKIGVSGITPVPRSGDGWLVLDKADGSAIILLWNAAQIDNGQGAEVTPSVNNATVTFAYPRSYRIHDPMGTASLTSGAFTTGPSVVVPLQGYVKVVEVAPPANWTAAGGDPQDTAATGSATFGVKQTGITGTVVDSGECTVIPPNAMTAGNTMVFWLFNNPGDNPQGPAGSTRISRYPRSGTNNNVCTTVWTMPISNPGQTFRFTGMQTWSGIAWAEVKAGTITPYGVDATLNNPNASNTTATFNGPAIPSGSVGLGTVELLYSPAVAGNTTGAVSSGEVTVLNTQTPTGNNQSGLYRFGWLFSLPSRAAGTVTASIPFAYGDNSSDAVATTVVLTP